MNDGVEESFHSIQPLENKWLLLAQISGWFDGA